MKMPMDVLVPKLIYFHVPLDALYVCAQPMQRDVHAWESSYAHLASLSRANRQSLQFHSHYLGNIDTLYCNRLSTSMQQQ